MKRRIIIRVLCCLIALMLPVSAMASVPGTKLLKDAHANGKEIVVTGSFTPGVSLASIEALNDLAKAASVKINYLPGGYVGMTFLLNGAESVSLQGHADKNGIYAASALLGEEPVYIGFEDLGKFILDLLKKQGMSDEEIAKIEESINSAMSGAANAVEAKPAAEVKALSEEEIYAQITKSMNGDEGMANWIKALMERKVVTTGEFAGDNHDTADTKTELTITQDDYIAMLDIAYVRDQLKKQFVAQNASMTEEEAAAKVDEEIEELKSELQNSVISVPVVVLTKGETSLCAVLIEGARFEITAEATTTASPIDVENTDPIDVENADAETAAVGDLLIDENVADATAPTETTVTENKKQVVLMDMRLEKKTTETGKIYTATMKATQNDAPLFHGSGKLTKDGEKLVLEGALTDNNDKPVLNIAAAYQPTDTTVAAEAAITISGDRTFVFSYNHTVSESAIDGSVAIAAGNSVAEIAATPEAVLGTINFRIAVQDDSGTFSKLVGATPETCVEVLKLNEQEMSDYSQKVLSSSSATLFTVMGQLPSSVFQLIAPFLSK